jgi:diguanylate cyclase (GGDEF)-like protein/PAS domain S-box-containing protein
VAVAGAVLVTLQVLAPDGAAGDATYLGALGLASLVGWVAAIRCRDQERRAWIMVALGISLSAAADLTYSVFVWTGRGEPNVSIADPLWIASYAALGLGVLRLTPGREHVRGPDVDSIIDSLVAAVIALLAVWELALEDMVRDSSTSILARATWSAYPVLDVVLLALVVRLALLHHRNRSPSVLLVGAGIASWLAADLGYLVVTAESALVWLDVGWMVASLLLALAIVARRHEPLSSVPATTDTPVRERMWLVIVPLLAPVAIDLRSHFDHTESSPLALGAATVALVVLACIRGHRLLRAAERARQAVHVSEAHYRALAAHSSDAVVVLDRDHRVVEASGNLTRLVGQDTSAIVGESGPEALACVDCDTLRTYLDSVESTPGGVAEHEIEVRHTDGDVRWLSTRMVNLLDDAAVAGIVVNLHDVTDRRRAQDELAHQAFHDALTGLANHALFTDRIEQTLRRTARTGATATVLYLDVDGFKSVNDRLGHDAGDTVLREVADRLRSTVRSADTVARLGGDEFAVLIEADHVQAGEARTTAERILQALSIPVDVDGQLIAISASIGLATGDTGSSAAILLRHADIAMYRAKANGKARIVVFDEQMGAEAGHLVRIEADLPGVEDRDELELHYQPVLELATGRLAGFEALVRWRHPELGLLAPDRFIPASEATRQIVPIGRWILETACASGARWRDAGDGPPPLTMAVNLSAVQLSTDEVVDDVRQALDRSGLDPSLLVLEITETGLVADPVAATTRLRALHELGVRLAIDDFGTGYSSLSYLRQFPIDILKIDRSFVDTITADDELPPIIRGLLDLARTLDLEIIAEGIERDVQHEGLRREACAMGQGFLFSRPLPAADVDRLLAAAPLCPPSSTSSGDDGGQNAGAQAVGNV